MNDRASVWRFLLPDGAMQEQASSGSRSIEAADGTLVVTGREPDGLGAAGEARAVAWLKAPPGGAARLGSRDFPRVRELIAVPGAERARWYLPVAPPRVTRRACDLYSPSTVPGVAARALARLISGAGGATLLGDRLVLASRAPSSLEAALAAMSDGAEYVALALPHDQGQRDRLWLLLIDRRGEALAFAKFAYRPDSVANLEREVLFTRHAANLPLRTCVVPDVLHGQAAGPGYLMASKPLPPDARASPARLTPQHWATLLELAGLRGTATSEQLVNELGNRCSRLTPDLPPAWADRLARALNGVSGCPGLLELPTVLAHGDFVPWNIRRRRGDSRLVVFDWEQGQECQFPLWDAFNFLAQGDIVLRRPAAAVSVRTALAQVGSSPCAGELRLTGEQVAALHLAYLADASVRWFEIHRPFSTWEYEMARTRTQPMRAAMLDAALAAFPLSRS